MTEIIAAPLRPAAQYLRMSTDYQRYSLANQAAVIGAYADAEGFDVVRTFEDAGVSGVTTAPQADSTNVANGQKRSQPTRRQSDILERGAN